jgi:DNA repair photolyase
VPFRYSLNPYRGCEHGCAYCYARPTHEYLGLNAGLDFESKIFVKHRAPELFREFLARDRWQSELIAMSGVTDCYQPAERRFRLTRACLEVALEARQPIGIITKNALVLRDLKLLIELARLNLVHVHLSVTSLDEDLARTMEPRTSRPAARLRAIESLAAAGVPASAMLAPVVPGLNDKEVPALLAAVAKAGAIKAGYTLVRLPLAVAPIFTDWLARTQPTRAARVEGLIRATRGGKLNSSQFGERMRGSGQIAEQIDQTFCVFARKYNLDGTMPALDYSRFRPPPPISGQLRLF